MCLQAGDLPPAVIPVHMAVVGCPISSQRPTFYTADYFQKEPVIRYRPSPLCLLQPLKGSRLPMLTCCCPTGHLMPPSMKAPDQGYPGGQSPQEAWLRSAHLEGL